MCAGVLVLMVDRPVTSDQALGPTAKDEWVSGWLAGWKAHEGISSYVALNLWSWGLVI